MEILKQLTNVKDIKQLDLEQLKQLAKEVRQVILDTVLVNGGHLASSLGAVETIIAMHYVFDAPDDKFIFDVGHQTYAHKILTGRLDEFHTVRKMGGLSGFPKRSESPYDTVNTGHSSTSLSVACGITRALNLNGDGQHTTVSLIGDGALTGGLAYEALNDCEELGHKQVILLNDNAMSISQNVGSTAKYLLKLHGSDTYQKFKNSTFNIINALDFRKTAKPFQMLTKAKNSIKYFLQGGMPFEQFGLRYFGPIDGHNFEQLINAFRIAKDEDDSVIIHIVTKKGRGYLEAEKNPAKYHGYSPSTTTGKSFSAGFGDGMLKIREMDDKVYAITAAMGDGVGLNDYIDKYPDSFADVGIAEAHAVTMASGLAIMGYKPYFAVYSSFLQRAYDSLIHDVCLQNLPVTFCIDRAGIVPGDGETHQGVYDVNFMNCVQNIAIANPRNNAELDAMLQWSLGYNYPLAIRYPKGISDLETNIEPIVLGKWQVLKDGESDVVILAMGASMVEQGRIAIDILSAKDIDATLVNARFAKPLDKQYLDTLHGKKIFTLEDNALIGGFGSCVLEYINRNNIDAKVINFAIDDYVLEHASVKELLDKVGLSGEKIADRIAKIMI